MSIPGQLMLCSDRKCPLPDNFSSIVLERCTCPAKAKLKDALSMKFKFDSFRPGQLQALLPLAHGKDVFVHMPTGGGKSLCMYLFPLALNDCHGFDNQSTCGANGPAGEFITSTIRHSNKINVECANCRSPS